MGREVRRGEEKGKGKIWGGRGERQNAKKRRETKDVSALQKAKYNKTLKSGGTENNRVEKRMLIVPRLSGRSK